MTKNIAISGLAVFLFLYLYGFVIHGILLSDIYAGADVYLDQEGMMAVWWAIPLGYLIMGLAFAYIFSKGYEGQGVAEGVRFGLVMGVFLAAVNLIILGTQPITPMIAAVTFLADVAMLTLAGLVVALVYKP